MRRANRMVDVLSARLQDVYTKWESRSKHHVDAQRLSYVGLQRYGHQERHRKRMPARAASKEVRGIIYKQN